MCTVQVQTGKVGSQKEGMRGWFEDPGQAVQRLWRDAEEMDAVGCFRAAFPLLLSK